LAVRSGGSGTKHRGGNDNGAEKSAAGRPGNGKEKIKDPERTFIGASIDTVLWRRLRAMAITEGKLTGELLDTAIQEYLDKHEK
jgi:hypothetical protein